MKFVVVLAALLVLVAAEPAGSVVLPPGFETEREVSGLTRATAVAWAPDGRRFVAEKDGLLKVAEPGGVTTRTILDIRDEVNATFDRGLLGLAVDVDFPSKPYVYLLYTHDIAHGTPAPDPDGPGPAVSQLLRATIGPGSHVVDSEVILGKDADGPCPPPDNALDCIPSDVATHTIGTVLSASDGTLFVGSGDGAVPALDTRALRAYDERSMSGKLLRIDRNGRGLPGHAFCPAETDLTLVCTKLYAKGLRNPFRFTQLPGGALFVGDVGWNEYEELNVLTAGGANLGWPCYEGPDRTPGWRDMPECEPAYAQEGSPEAAVAPTFFYRRSTPSAAVVAGPQYTGTAYPAAYSGRVFWGDYGSGFLRSAELAPTGLLGPVDEFGDGLTALDLKAAPNGDLVWVDVGDWGSGTAFVERMIYTPGNRKPAAVAAAEPDDGEAPLTVEFDASGSTDPDEDVISHRWDFGDGSAAVDGATATHTYTEAGTYLASLTVTDDRGRTDSDTVEINASNSPPVPHIDLPSAAFRYRNDAPVHVEGSAADAEDGPLPGSRFEWNVRLVHHDHEHSLSNPVGVEAFEFDPVRDHDADSHYAVRLTVTDSGGATRSVEREILPETVPVHLRSVPGGAPLSYAGAVAVTPWDTRSVVGFLGTVTAPETYVSGGVERDFARWSSGAPRVHEFRVPATPTELTAFYNASPSPVANAVGARGSAPLEVTLDASGSSDADGDELTFSWDPGDGGPVLHSARAGHTYRSAGSYTASVTVSDRRGGASTESVRISVHPDRSGPAIRAWRPRPRRRVVAGVVRDPSGVAVMRVAIARAEGPGRCRWMRGRRPRLATIAPCERKRWLGAAIERRRWRVELPRRLPAGRYLAWLLARDRAGNETRRTADGRRLLRFTVSRAAARVR